MYQKAENMAEKWVHPFFGHIFSFGIFLKGPNIIRPFKPLDLLSFYENSALIFLIFGPIFGPFQFFGSMVSAFCDFYVPFRARFLVSSRPKNFLWE